MPKYLSSIILYSSVFAVIIPFILSIIKINRVNAAFKVLAWQLSFATAFNAVAMVLNHLRINNLPLLHAYTVIEFTFIACFFYHILAGLLSKKMLVIILLSFGILSILNIIFNQGLLKFNTLPRSVESFIVIILSITCYYQMLMNLHVKKIYTDPVFWVNTGFLVYFSGSLFLFMMSNYILPLNHKLNMLVWVIHAIFSDILYLFISIGLWQNRKT